MPRSKYPEAGGFAAKFHESDQTFHATSETKIEIVSSGDNPYAGPYTVTPRVADSVILGTKGKTMTTDVDILRIPQYLVSNDAGGKTIIIGEEYYK